MLIPGHIKRGAALELKFSPVMGNMMIILGNHYEVDSSVGSRDMEK